MPLSKKPINLMEIFTERYGVHPIKCFIEDVYYNCSIDFKNKHDNKIIGYLQYEYKSVILPFYYMNKRIEPIRCY